MASATTPPPKAKYSKYDILATLKYVLYLIPKPVKAKVEPNISNELKAIEIANGTLPPLSFHTRRPNMYLMVMSLIFDIATETMIDNVGFWRDAGFAKFVTA